MSQSAETLIRIVQQNDAPMLRDHRLGRNTLEEVMEKVQTYLARHADGECIPLVAQVGGLVVGLAALHRDPHPLRRHRATLYDVVVNGDYRGRGIARSLVASLRELAAQMGVEALETSVRGGTPAEEVYRRLGFTEYGRLPRGLVEPWGDGQAFDEVYLWMPAGP